MKIFRDLLKCDATDTEALLASDMLCDQFKEIMISIKESKPRKQAIVRAATKLLHNDKNKRHALLNAKMSCDELIAEAINSLPAESSQGVTPEIMKVGHPSPSSLSQVNQPQNQFVTNPVRTDATSTLADSDPASSQDFEALSPHELQDYLRAHGLNIDGDLPNLITRCKVKQQELLAAKTLTEDVGALKLLNDEVDQSAPDQSPESIFCETAFADDASSESPRTNLSMTERMFNAAKPFFPSHANTPS